MQRTTICSRMMNISDLFKKTSYWVMVGSLGSLLLVVFFTTMMSYGTIEKLLPWVIGFNAALTGYNLITRTNNSLKYKQMLAVGSGILMVIMSVLFINIIFFNLMDGYLVYVNKLIFLMTIGAIFSGLGAILAIKYINLRG